MKTKCKLDPEQWQPYKVPWWKVFGVEVTRSYQQGLICSTYAYPGDVIRQRGTNTPYGIYWEYGLLETTEATNGRTKQ